MSGLCAICKWNRISFSATSIIKVNKAKINEEWKINGAGDMIAPNFHGLHVILHSQYSSLLAQL